MATITTVGFTGGAVDTAMTTATEPAFTDFLGLPTYGVDKYGNPGLKHVSGSGHGGMSMGGRTQIRVSYNYYRASGTQTSYLLLNAFRQGATNIADMSVRNAGGGQPGARINFAWTDQLLTDSIDNGEQWHIEDHWIQGEGLHVYLWKDGTPQGAPWDYHLFGANTTYTPDNFRIGHSNAATGITGVISQLVVTDGEPVWVVDEEEPEPTPGTLNYNMTGLPTSSSFRTVARTTGALSVRLKVSTAPDLSASPIYTTPQTPDADGYTKHEATGLAANTQYYYGTEVDGIVATTKSGKAKTFPAVDSHASFTFWSGSCHDATGASVFVNIQNRNPLFGVQLGDLGYQYLTGSPNGAIAPADLASNLLHRLSTIESELPNSLYRNIPFSYTYSDCDGGGANADKTWPGFVSGAVQAAYRKQFPHPALPLADSGARAWVVGRWHFTQTDENTMATDKTVANNSTSKSKLGSAQLAWLFDEWLAAKAAGRVIVWCGDGPWMAGSPTGTSNTWARYEYERGLIGQFILDNELRIIRIHGDDHSLYADDGTNNAFGEFPVICAAPMATTAQVYGGTTTQGKYPTVQTASARQYGYYEAVDTGNEMSLIYHGIGYTVGAPTEIERVTMTTTWSMTGGFAQPWTTLTMGSNPITTVSVGDHLIWEAP